MWIADSLDTIKTPTSVALGNFDGVHQGHRQVIQPIFSMALGSDRLGKTAIAQSSASPLATVVSFYPHPQEFFTGTRRLLLTPLAEKIHYLKAIGVEQLVLLPFDQELASHSPKEFVEKILIQRLQVRQISIGQDFRFGQKRAGTAADLEAIATSYQIPVRIAPLQTCEGERISSSAIRHNLEQGNVQEANVLLGRPFTLLGQVAQGQQLGRTIGFPTANLEVPVEKFLPRQGVYSVWVQIGGFEGAAQPGVMNIGNRPTVNGIQQTIEVHLLDWAGDLYGQTLAVSLESFLRSEQKFASLEELKTQIAQDSEVARSRLR
ncbi:MAG: bifunctional riboflavin kinase/FAD synthetase [Drouetiella hepatica Uher 2000/2452]|uniref:Riboflavin biosynthesis protein n=1 Tax=Drouetiella hepatica Uher 2000/2452 TaxID=904376 RepID=A0A951Q6X9_9CYAN|nr:bifunctional riboflavin kinase/FAD synthetase [Drouetiella hepatica Uher 2000/2452]